MAGRNRAVLPEGSQDEIPRSAARARYTYLPWVDLICAGVPCQDVSVAGQRLGLAGKRTRLVYHFARILRELRPTWFLFENVPGLLSSNEGRDFAEVIRLFMVQCGYGVAWRVLDSQFFGVAQRRSRLFIVGRFGAPCPASILFEAESGSRDYPKGGKIGQDVAATLTSGIGITGNAPGRRREDDTNLVVGCLESRHAGVYQSAQSDSRGHLVTYWDGGQLADTLDSSMLGKQQAMPDKRRFAAIVFEPRWFTRDNKCGGQPAEISAVPTSGKRNGDSTQMVCAPTYPDRVRTFAGLPNGLDSARYRALGNAVTVSVAEWIGRRIVEASKETSDAD